MQELIKKKFVRKCFHTKGRSDWKSPPQVPYKINKTKRKRHSYPSHYPNNVVLTWKLEHGQCQKIIKYLNVFSKGRY